jgi:hypothetical protein
MNQFSSQSVAAEEIGALPISAEYNSVSVKSW